MNDDRQAINDIASTEFENLSEGEAQSMLTHVVHKARQVRDVRRPIPSDIEKVAVMAFVTGTVCINYGRELSEDTVQEFGDLLRDELNVDINAIKREVDQIVRQDEDIDDGIGDLVQQVLMGDPRWVKAPLPNLQDVEIACHEAVVAELNRQYAGRISEEPVPYTPNRDNTRQAVRNWVDQNVV